VGTDYTSVMGKVLFELPISDIEETASLDIDDSIICFILIHI
jgi:hypothetical protein